MLNIVQIIANAVRVAGDRPAIGAPFPLSIALCRRLSAEGMVAGFIADKRPEMKECDPGLLGWWVDRSRGRWFLRNIGCKTIALLGAAPQTHVNSAMLLEARLKGVRRILLMGEDGAVTSDIDVESTLLRRIDSTQISNPIHKVSYEGLFEDIFSWVGESLRLPQSAFESDRMLLVTGSLDPGGAERQVAYTATGLSERFPGQVHLGRAYAGSDRDFFRSMVTQSGVRLHAIPHHSPEYDLPAVQKIRNSIAEKYPGLGALSIFEMVFHHALMLREVRPGIVHTWQDFSNVLAGVAAVMVGVPRLIFSGRSVAADHFAFFQGYMAPAYRSMYRRRDITFLNNSYAGAEDYARWLGLPRDKFRVIHNGFVFSDIGKGAGALVRQQESLSQNDVIVGTVIRFGEEKRPELILEVAKLVCEKNADVKFLLFGDGPLLARSRSFVVENGLSDSIKLPGLTQDAWSALDAMDIFILTSRVEGLPNVMIEAQAMGVPVICTGAGGMAETFVEGDTGFAIRSQRAEDLAAAVLNLVERPEKRRKMGKMAAAYVRNAFGLDRMVSETLEAYRSASEHVSYADWTPAWVDLSTPDDILLQGAQREQGACFVAAVPEQPGASLVLWEDDKILGPSTSVDDVRASGGGRYCVKSGEIFLSSSDGSDVRFNGRTYRLRKSDASLGIEEVLVKSESVISESGFCFISTVELGAGAVRFNLWEDDRKLGPGDSLHDDIRQSGAGRFSVWRGSLFFSSSDGSDPRSNGRTYRLRSARPTAVHKLDKDALIDVLPEVAFRYLRSRSVKRPDYVRGRIVHIGGSLGPGGAERQILYTLKGLCCEPSVESAQLLCYYLGTSLTYRHDFYLPEFQAAGIPVRTIRRHVGSRELERMPNALQKIAHVLPEELVTDIANLYWEFVELKPEIVHAWLDGNNERAGFAAALAGVPRIIISGRNMNPTHFAFYADHMAPAYRALLGLPQVTMLNNSKAGRDDYADWLGVEREQIAVVYNGTDFSGNRLPSQGEIKTIKSSFSLREGSFVIGGIFRFSDEKRPLLWIETAAEILRRIPNAHFILFGHGDLQDEMQALAARSGVSDHLIFAGVTADIMSALSAMDVLLLASKAEGIPNVVLEAQWAGVPVVATNAGGAVEALDNGKTGWIVDPATPANLAGRVEWLAQNLPERPAAQAAGQRFILDNFSRQKMINRTLQMYGMASSVHEP